MEPSDAQATDASSIKAVSSLRSQFENLASSKPPTPTPPPLKPKSFSISQPLASSSSAAANTTSTTVPLDLTQPDSARASFDLPANAGDISHITRTKRRPPSPPKPRRTHSAVPPSLNTSAPEVSVTSPTSPPKTTSIPAPHPARHASLHPASQEHPNGHFRIPSRSSSNSPSPTPQTSSHQSLDTPTAYPPRESSLQQNPAQQKAKPPPPVNRRAKPSLGKEIGEKPVESSSPYVSQNQNTKTSPFSTPPSSNESSPAQSPPPLPIHSKPRPPPVQTQALQEAARKTSDALEEAPPGLPPRRIVIPSRSEDTLTGSSNKPSALTQGFSNKSQSGASAQLHSRTPSTGYRNLTPPPRLSNETRRPTQPSRNFNVIPAVEYETRTPSPAEVATFNSSDYPDSSRANRRHPHYPDGPRMISTGYDPRLVDVCGQYVCTTGSITRVWNLLTGKLLLSITHGETIRITALCFTPARKIDLEGSRIWLGTNWGEILEVDIASKKVVASNSLAHNRHEIVKMHRSATNIWSLDSEGKLYLWPEDASGSPSLENSTTNGKLSRRPSASIPIGDELWMAYGKEIKIYKPNAQSEEAQLINMQPMSHQGAGDIACVATLSDKVYFGHTDGKISIYDCKTYEFLELVSVSIYKITSLAGVGSYLWAGYGTGTMFVYDTLTKPWAIKKSWRAHGGPVVGFAIDQSNIWKLDRLTVASLGVDNYLSIWDGMLKEDWLDDDLLDHSAEFCKSRGITALVLTWNTGASTPTDLRYDQEDSNFFREFLLREKAPDFVVFGLQELVDLEDKALTAKSFFKSRHKDAYGQEHLSSVYRAWRDYLGRCLEEAMPVDESYTLLHTASLVGLFSCIFVKSAHMSRIRDVQAVEVKTGMGGLHGNKGAIAVRCIMDDSSLCFVNCHLAAGQAKTMERNNDVAVIFESSALPPSETQLGVFVGGGDGSMILDHEICILSGDLNYRIETMTRDSIISAIKADNFTKLLERDQLTLSRRKNPGFRLRAFRELPITFQPTYKYDVGTDTYDTSEKRRAPAWCDRIMCRGTVEQLDYQRHEVRVADHRPVSGSFKIDIKKVDRGKREECRAHSVRRFAQYKDTISTSSKLEYLTSVFGLSRQEALQELASLQAKRNS